MKPQNVDKFVALSVSSYYGVLAIGLPHSIQEDLSPLYRLVYIRGIGCILVRIGAVLKVFVD